MHGSSFFLCLELASLAVAGPVQIADRQTQKLRIMPLGDSITEITCWRTLMWDQIAEAGYADKTANWGEHHEGHSGWLAIDIANNYLTTWLKNTPADIVMFMLGTNDVVRGHTADDIIAAYTKMVNIMRAANPKMKIIVAPSRRSTRASARIRACLNSTDSPIVIADCNTGVPTWDLRDGVHPNAAGDKILASRIGPLLLDYIKGSLAA
ncbi:hypothetical protein VTG60DRAFT_662 [Thermothelomyces hinnuleus]